MNNAIYTLQSAKFAHVFFLADEGVLIDCGMPWEGKKILAELTENGFDVANVKRILLTHGDVDHVGSVNILQKATGATVWIGKDDATYPTAKKKAKGLKSLVKNFLIKILTPKLPKDIRFLEDWQQPEIEALHTPGHTKGHYAFRYKDNLFIGDIYKNTDGKLTSPGVNREPASLEKTRTWLKTIDPKQVKIIPSHGEQIKKM